MSFQQLLPVSSKTLPLKKLLDFKPESLLFSQK
jgi:hypothetical protein